MSITEKKGVTHWKEKRIYIGKYTGNKYAITVDAPTHGIMESIFKSASNTIAGIENIIQNISESEESENDEP